MVVGVAGLVVATLLVLASQALAGGVGESRSSSGIVFERGGDLYAIAVDGSRTVRLTNTPVWDEEDPSASRNGRWIAFSRGRSYATTLWVMSVDGRSSKRLNSRDSGDPAWSPDGRTIFFVRRLAQVDGTFREWCGALFRIGADGSGETRLTNAPWKDAFDDHSAPAVSPDGLRIAFTDANQCSGGTASFALRVIDTTGHTTSDLAHLPANGYYPSTTGPDYGGPTWSPDGTRLAFYGEEHQPALYVAYRDGTGRRRLTPKTMRAAFLESDSPAWSPDGKWIAFTTSDHGQDLYIIHPDGTGMKRLTRTMAHEASPSWLAKMPSN